MAGRPKQGIDYSGWSVDIFDSDKKIDKLIDAHGWKGFGIYFFLCQRAYKSNGYFYEWGYDDCATTARKMGGGITSGIVKETVSYCLQIALFDEGVFDRWGVLTSRGIQRRFWSVLSERRSKIVYDEYWLLEEDECKGLVKIRLNDDLQPTNGYLQPTNGETLSRKKSKVKKSKVKNNNAEQQTETYFHDTELNRLFTVYLSEREKAEKRSLSQERIRMLCEELTAMASDDTERIEIVKKAIASGWKSFYPIKKAETGKQAAKGSNRFNNFHQREYDMAELERELLKK